MALNQGAVCGSLDKAQILGIPAGCLVLEGATAYVGFDICKDAHSNYWYCDGVADDVQINLAEAYVTALGGGTVELERGTFTLADPIIPTGNAVWYKGQGRDTFIDGDGLATTEHAFHVTGRTDIKISDLSIQTQDAGGKTCHCIFIEDGADRFLIENVTVVDSDSDGIHIEGTTITGGTVRGCYVLDTDNYGIHIDMDAGGWAYNFLITENEVTGGGNSNIAFSASSGNTYCEIVDNISYSSDGAEGIYVVAFHEGIIANNVCYSNATEGIQVGSTSTYTAIANNICQLNSGHGIFLENADYCSVTDNICEQNDYGDTGNFDGIHIDIDSTDNLVEGNICYGNHRFGINIRGMRTDVTGNHVEFNDLTGIYVFGAESNINDNYCYDDGQETAGTYSEITLDSSADRVAVSDNYCDSPGDSSEHGIHLGEGASNISVVGNYCYNGMGSGICLDDDNDNCHIVGNYCMLNDDYGIEIMTDTCNNNIVKENYLTGNVAGCIFDGGTDTGLPFFWEKPPNPDSNIGWHPAQQMLDGIDTYIRNQTYIPLEYQELVTAQIVVAQGTAANPNMVWTCDTDWGKVCSAEDYFTHTDSAGATTALAQDDLVCLDFSGALTGIAPGDLVGVSFMRDGDAGADTVGGPVYYLGIRVRYV